jgi:hypothetical protein
MVCGAPLTYHEKAEELKCLYCGRLERGHISCPGGHYICDLCHNSDSMRIIEDTMLSTPSGNPFEIAEIAMRFPGLPMLGCQHAYIAGGALMAAIKNAGNKGITNAEIKEVLRRTVKQAHGGYCGLTGVCGVAPAIGACFAVLTGSKCGKDEEQRITMEAVTRVARAITELTGPSCCKAYVWNSLEAAAIYLSESLGIILPSSQSITCSYSARHPHGCREARCPYFDDNSSKKSEEISIGGAETMNLKIVTADVKEGKTLEDGTEQLLKRALELGVEKAKSIDPASIVVEEWVRWKCQYGCQLYEKDAYHPPCAPPAESTAKVIREYSRALLLNGPRGKELTEAVVRLEGEAYQLGYYKAFALTALSSGPAGAA